MHIPKVVHLSKRDYHNFGFQTNARIHSVPLLDLRQGKDCYLGRLVFLYYLSSEDALCICTAQIVGNAVDHGII